MMKKYACKVLAAAMAVSMMVPGVSALAAENATVTNTTQPSNCETSVSYTVSEGYTWQVPATVTFEADAGVSKTRTANGEVKVTKNVIGEGKTLKIKIASDEDFQIKTGSSTILTYTVKKNDTELAKGGEILSVAAGTDKDTQNLVYTLSTSTGVAEVAGTYTGTLNYVATVE